MILSHGWVAYLKCSDFKSKSYILGFGKGFFLIFLLSSLKSEMKWPASFFLEFIKVGAATQSYFDVFMQLYLLIYWLLF